MISVRTTRVWRLSGAAIAVALLTVALVTQASAPAGHFTATAGTVHDNKTGLTWQQAVPSGTFTWGSTSTTGTAQNYCATLSVNGVGGWRLPTMKELTTIIDYSAQGPVIDATVFPNTPANEFWTSTLLSGESNLAAWEVNFSNGGTYDAPFVEMQYVRCVR